MGVVLLLSATMISAHPLSCAGTSSHPLQAAPAGSDAEKLAPFVSDLLRVGSVKGGFQVLSLLLERERRAFDNRDEPAEGKAFEKHKEVKADPDAPLFVQDSLMISGRTQRRLSGYGYINVGLPPASPSDREITPHDELSTTNSQKDADADAKAKDSPLKLKTTSAWANKVVKVWDVIAEIVEVCCQPSPANPLAVDHSYFASLEGLDKILESSAMVYFLQRVLDSGSHPFDDKVANDLRLLGQMHFEAVHDVMGSDTASSSSSSSGGGGCRRRRQGEYAKEETKPNVGRITAVDIPGVSRKHLSGLLRVARNQPQGVHRFNKGQVRLAGFVEQNNPATTDCLHGNTFATTCRITAASNAHQTWPSGRLWKMLDFVHANVISYCCVTNRSANHDNNAFDNLGRSMPPMPAFVYSPAA
eukprot:gene1635-30171_t